MSILDLVKLTPLMKVSRGRPDIAICLIDGPVAINHPSISSVSFREIPGSLKGTCARASSIACTHGTFIAGILFGKRESVSPAICPDCTLLLRPIFAETSFRNGQMPTASSQELAVAIVEAVAEGSRIVNLSIGLEQTFSKGSELHDALDYAAEKGTIVVAAAGNQGLLAASSLTRHPWVIPTAACDAQGRPINYSNLGRSIGRSGLIAPGDRIVSLGVDGANIALSGTSAAAPFVTGTIALLWSEFPKATAGEVRFAVTQASGTRRAKIVPPLLNAWEAYLFLAKSHSHD